MPTPAAVPASAAIPAPTEPRSPGGRKPYASVVTLLVAALGCGAAAWAFQPDPPPPGAGAAEPADATADGLASAVFAGGCFWCMEPPFDKLKGVVSTTSGYTAGKVKNPTYEQVSAGRTGHAEALKVVYDPKQVSYDTLLKVFWRNVDPLRKNAQFCDRGTQYRSAVYYSTPAEKTAAEASLKTIQARFEQPVATQIALAETFYDAEGYHQDYYLKNPIRYKYYRYSCGRDERLKEVWGEEAGAANVLKKFGKKAPPAEEDAPADDAAPVEEVAVEEVTAEDAAPAAEPAE